jgi:hypothetical protein
MKVRIIYIVPKGDVNLKSVITNKVRTLKGGAFYFDNAKLKHKRYAGWINLNSLKYNILQADVQCLKKVSVEQILSSFVAFLVRHFENDISSISIYLKYPLPA